MITLRGRLTRAVVEAKAATPATTRSNVAPSESAAADAAPAEAGAIQEISSKESAVVEEWLWRGVWAFGSLPDQDGDVADASTSLSDANDMLNQTQRQENKGSTEDAQSWIQKLTSRITDAAESAHAEGPSHEPKKSTDGIATSAPRDTHRQPAASVALDDLTPTALQDKPRPFSYRFIKLVDASHVIVPSSLVSSGDDENTDAYAPEKMDHLGGARRTTSVPIDSNEELGGVPKKDAHDLLVSSNANDKQNQHADESGQVKEQAYTNQVDNSTKNHASNSLTPSIGDALVQHPSKDAKIDDEKPADSADGTMSGDKSPPTTQNPEKTTHPTMTAAAIQPPQTAQTNFTSSPNKQTYGDAPYTDAHLTHPPGTCPPGGKWEGHFENIEPYSYNPYKKRKDKKDNRIREMFYLFFNATPSPDARTAFVAEDSTSAANHLLTAAGDGETDESKQQDDANHLLLPKGRMHVRGYGTNRFGTFEIVGSFDPKSGMLHCQRMYVQTPLPDREASSSRKQKRSSTGQFSTGRGRSSSVKKDAGEGKRGRKRKPSLKKRHMDSFGSFESGDGGAIFDDCGLDIATIVKKRARLAGESGSGTGAIPIASALPQCRGDDVQAMNKLVALGPISSKLTPSMKGSGTKTIKPKKKPTSSLKENSMARIAPPLVDIIEPLPSEGDPFLARWRAAHFLYYQRVETTADGGEAVSAAANPTGGKVNCVVYEGEMMDGYREGMGICLYGNGTMYEGQWKRNKEHGKGTLMTPDRSKIIYQGDWERGRMHGAGSYYYHKDVSLGGADVSGKEMGHYVGEFRENQRNGRGTYTFPDGSVYEGEWRDNTPNGWGVFRWPDNSLFQGMWKDGRRHGNCGTLIVSDGFRYEGAWVDNAMEGRGVATYPGGQIYEGMWVAGRREGRGTIRFTNGAIYEGRFKDDNIEGQGTMKMSRNVIIPPHSDDEESGKDPKTDKSERDGLPKNDWMIPIEFQSDISHIHQKAGFTQVGL